VTDVPSTLRLMEELVSLLRYSKKPIFLWRNIFPPRCEDRNTKTKRNQVGAWFRRPVQGEIV
jgi:hypothetical protein